MRVHSLNQQQQKLTATHNHLPLFLQFTFICHWKCISSFLLLEFTMLCFCFQQGNMFQNAVFNETIQVVEPDEGLDGET